MDIALFISQLDVAKVLFELDVKHFLSHNSIELVRFNVHFHFGLLVAPGELGNFLLHNWNGSGGSGSLGALIRAVCLDQDWITSVDLAICFEVLCSLSGEVLGRVGIVIL